jgi:hypothetical protein
MLARFDLAQASPRAFKVIMAFDGYIAQQKSVPQSLICGFERMAAERLLRNAGARNAYLLTNSAASLFEQAGFILIDRCDALAKILATRQATSLCPSTAKLLRLPISVAP